MYDIIERIAKRLIAGIINLIYRIRLFILERCLDNKQLRQTDVKKVFPNKVIKQYGGSYRKIQLKDCNEILALNSYYHHPDISRKLRACGYKEGIDFISVIDGQYLRENLEKKGRQYDWKRVEKYRRFVKKYWEDRVKIMASLIDDNVSSVLDIGCWDCKLKPLLRQDVAYYGCDYQKRFSDTIVCDLNKGEFPEVEFDCAFISGNLEYIMDVDWYLDKVCQATREVVMSYTSLEYVPIISRRKHESWVCHLTLYEVISKMYDRGFDLVDSTMWEQSTPILKFTKRGQN